MPADSIRRKDIASHLLAQLEDRPGIARNAYVATSAVHRWAMKRGLVEDNPATKIAAPKPKARDRVLSHDEIRLLWHATDDLGAYGRIFRLLLPRRSPQRIVTTRSVPISLVSSLRG
jgi:site-specific recombinase XerD